MRAISGYGVEPISRILAVEFFCLTSSNYDSYPSLPLDSTPPSSDYYEDSTAYQTAGSRPELPEHPCAPIRKILSSASFYYSSGENAFDLSTRLQARLARKEANEKGKGSVDGEEEEEYDPRFLWNTYLVTPLLAFRASLALAVRTVFDRQAFVVLAIQGFAGVYDMSLGGQPAVLSLISRLSWKRAGTRFNVR
jgi:hypothetical protein